MNIAMPVEVYRVDVTGAATLPVVPAELTTAFGGHAAVNTTTPRASFALNETHHRREG
jgi:hypothetical protein